MSDHPVCFNFESEFSNLGFEKIKTVVFEEIEELLSRDSQEQLLSILKMLPRSVQIVACAPTAYPTRIEFAERLMKNPILIFWRSPDLSLEGIRQFYIHVSDAVQYFFSSRSLIKRVDYI